MIKKSVDKKQNICYNEYSERQKGSEQHGKKPTKKNKKNFEKSVDKPNQKCYNNNSG